KIGIRINSFNKGFPDFFGNLNRYYFCIPTRVNKAKHYSCRKVRCKCYLRCNGCYRSGCLTGDFLGENILPSKEHRAYPEDLAGVELKNKGFRPLKTSNSLFKNIDYLKRLCIDYFV